MKKNEKEILLPNFVGSNIKDLEKWAKKNKIEYTVDKIKKDNLLYE